MRRMELERPAKVVVAERVIMAIETRGSFCAPDDVGRVVGSTTGWMPKQPKWEPGRCCWVRAANRERSCDEALRPGPSLRTEDSSMMGAGAGSVKRHVPRAHRIAQSVTLLR